MHSQRARAPNTSREFPDPGGREPHGPLHSAAGPAGCAFPSPSPRTLPRPHPNPTGADSKDPGLGQLLPPHPGSPVRQPWGGQRICWADRAGKLGAPGAASLLTWRSLGPSWGIRRVPASPRARCAPGRRRPAPALAKDLALHGARGLARGPGKLVQLAAAPQALAARQWLLAFPRPSSARPSVAALRSPGPAKLVSLLRDGASRLPSAAAAAPHGRDWGRALPLSLPGAERVRTASLCADRRGPGRALCPPCAPAAGGPPAAASASRVPRPGRSQLSQRSRLPEGCVRHAASSASLSRRPRLSWPPPGVGDRASPESWRGPGSPELSSLGKGSRTLSMPSHVPRQVTECVSRFDGRRVGRETVPTDFEKRIL